MSDSLISFLLFATAVIFLGIIYTQILAICSFLERLRPLNVKLNYLVFGLILTADSDGSASTVFPASELSILLLAGINAFLLGIILFLYALLKDLIATQGFIDS